MGNPATARRHLDPCCTFDPDHTRWFTNSCEFLGEVEQLSDRILRAAGWC
ncbi:unnamed protein product [Ectocarpus sp. CCAP 1310/34]|nr:unnamed protein product [Ectocarpus sp. CCAP 1310/34]